LQLPQPIHYVWIMRALLPGLLLLLPVPASAMNWEGKDDWMADMEPAAVYEASAPHASPPQAACKPLRETPPDNPYEQVPLERHACPGEPPEAGTNR
jgi:hypothetical protein